MPAPPSPFVLLLTGAAGAGKTSAAAAWASQRAEPTAHWSLDDVRRGLSSYRDPEAGWNDETRAQLELARAVVAAAARTYVARGVAVVVDDAVFPDRPAAGYERWQAELDGIETRAVVLLPRLEIVLERNRGRPEQTRLREDTVRSIYESMEQWRERELPVIDNSALTPRETAQAMDDYLRSPTGERLPSGL